MKSLRSLFVPLAVAASLWGTAGFFALHCTRPSSKTPAFYTELQSDTAQLCREVSGTARIACLLRLADSMTLQSPDVALYAATQALQAARQAGDRPQEAASLFHVALAGFQKADDKAFAAPLAAAKAYTELCKNNGYTAGVAKGYALIAGIQLYSDTLHVDSTLTQAIQALREVRRNRNDSLWTAAYIAEVQMGRAAQWGLLQACKAHALTATRLYGAAHDGPRVGHAYESLFKMHIEYVPDPDSARHYLDLCKNWYTQSGTTGGLRSATLNYAIACSHQYQNTFDPVWYAEGTAAVAEAIVLSPAKPYAEAELQRGILYQQKAFFLTKTAADSARYYTAKAYAHYKVALEAAERGRNEAALQTIAANLSSTCRVTGGCDTMMQQIACSYQKILDFRRQEAHQGQLLLEHYKNEEAEQRRKNLLLGAGLLLAAVTILFLWVYQRTRLRNLRRELEMKLEALRAQMNPHFISNCLNAIDSLINHGKNQEASHYIIRFSRLCRMVLNNARHKVISLSEELDMLDYFVSLEKLRFGDDRLQYRVMVDPSLNKDEIAVPPMLLQPFVENAIWHGIQPKSGPGLVQVEVRRMDQTSYQCIIEDDGIGRQKSQEIKSRSVLKHNSLGMAITQERLQGFAGAGNAQLDIQDLQSGTGAPVGTRVIITLPILPL
jgi:two-component sensor histidine kinase